jgi:hypothetical protein
VSGASKPAASDALFTLPLGEFTAARNALVAQLKKDGRQAEASEVKALAKPSVSAWVVNQLYWRHRKPFDALLEAGDRLRRAHAAPLTGESARDPVTARREVVAELVRHAADVLREAGHGDTRDLMRRVTSTLEALSSYGSLPAAPVAGRLVDDVEPPGFEAVLGLLPTGNKRAPAGRQLPLRSPAATAPTKRSSRAEETGAATRRAAEERKRLVATSKAAVRTAERALNAAREQAERAATTLEAAARRAKVLDGERAQLEKRLARISQDAEAAHAAAREAAARADRATQAAKAAERDLELEHNRFEELASSRD